MAVRRRRYRSAPVRSPYRQPWWMIAGVAIIAAGTTVLVVAAILTWLTFR